MTIAQIVETSVTNNSSFQNYTHPDDHTTRITDTPGFKPFTLQQIKLHKPVWQVQFVIFEKFASAYCTKLQEKSYYYLLIM